MSSGRLADAQLIGEDPGRKFESDDKYPTRLCEQCMRIIDFLTHDHVVIPFGAPNWHLPALANAWLILSLKRFYNCSVCSITLGKVPFEDLAAKQRTDTPTIKSQYIKAGTIKLVLYTLDGTLLLHYGTVSLMRRDFARSWPYTMEKSINSPSTWNLARSWLTDCDDNHSCRIESFRELPTRLVYLGNEALQPRLIETKHLLALSYCTLSHCWGKAEILVLKKANYADFLRQIPMELLTQTFRDGMFAARQLGFRYIWIDSLCIVQDHPADWTKESGTMSNVYSMSSLNLAATSGIDGSVGLFHDRNVRLVQFPEVTPSAQSDRSSNSPVYNRSQDFKPPTYVLFNSTLWAEEITNSVLASRGWVLQERYLAPRTLHFGRNQIFWECRRCKKAESFVAAGIDTPRDIDSLEDYQYELHSAILGNRHNELQSSAMDVWRSVVERYSRTSLTKEKDKLVAIAGIAKSLHQYTKDDYLAGMWGSELELDLLWYTCNARRSSDSDLRAIYNDDQPLVSQPFKPASYRAPSWSWASMDSEIKMYSSHYDADSAQDDHAHALITITQWSITPLNGSDVYGEILAGHLIIECPPLRKEQDFASSCKMDGYFDQGCYFSRTGVQSQDVDRLLSNTYFLLVTLSGAILRGLLITPTGSIRGEYERVGEYTIEARGESPPSFPIYSLDEFLVIPTIEEADDYFETPAADPKERKYRIKLV